MDALKAFPEHADSLETAKGVAYLQKKDIFKNLMWYSFRDSNKQYPLSINKVKEILKLNKEGKKPDELQPEEIEQPTHKTTVKTEMGFVNDVGQISLKGLQKTNNKKKKKPQPEKGATPQKSVTPNQPVSQKNDNRNTKQRPPSNDNKEGNKGNAAAPQQQRPSQNSQKQRTPQQQRPNRPPRPNTPPPPKNNEENG